jgi:hypothetical protein
MESKPSNSEINKVIVDYINSKMGHFKLAPISEKNFSEFAKKYTKEQMFRGIDIAANKYIKIQNNIVDGESIGPFLNKLTGIITIEGNPIKQKECYIRGIGRNRFNESDRFWSDENASFILKKLISTCNKCGYNEKQILEYLDEKVIPLTKHSYYWAEWCNCMNSYIKEIKNEAGQ